MQCYLTTQVQIQQQLQQLQQSQFQDTSSVVESEEEEL